MRQYTNQSSFRDVCSFAGLKMTNEQSPAPYSDDPGVLISLTADIVLSAAASQSRPQRSLPCFVYTEVFLFGVERVLKVKNMVG